jgi:tape measure domain-containing protein
MASNETVLKIKAQIENLEGLNQLKTALRKSSAEAKGADNDFKGLVQKVRELQSASVKSINNLNAQKDAFEALRRSVDVTSKEFKEARDEIEKIDRALKEASGTVVRYSKNSINALRAQKNELLAVRDSADLMSKEFKEAGVELAKLDKKLAKAEGRKIGGGRLRAGAQIAGTVAGAGVFGGPEGAIGALGGGLIGGVGGAVLGGAIGAQVGQARKAAGEVAEYVAELNLAKGALGGVSKDIVEYNQNLDFAREISKKYAIRLTDVVKGLTGVTAAAKANNLTVKQTQAIYEGITVSGVAAGKSQEDLQALFLATTQVLSKGKASAEEISGQIGERIPGAVAKFAAANKISLQELAEQFKKGEVTIAKFVRFAEQQGEDYAEVAEALASGPEKAGIRLQIALDEAGEAFGGFFLNTGAGFQNYLTNLVDFVVKNQVEFKKLIAATVVFAQDFVNVFVSIGKAIWDIFGPLFELIGNTLKGFIEATADVLQQGQAERAARKQGIDAFAARKEAEAQIVKEDGGRNYLDIGQGDRISKRYTRLLSKKAGLETETSSRQSRIDALIKTFGGKYVSPAFAKPGQTAPPAADLDGDGDGNKTGKTKTKGPGRADFIDLEASFVRDAAEKVQKAEVALRIKIAEARKEENKELVFALEQERELLKVNQIIDSLRDQIRQRAIQIAEAQGKGLDVSGGIRKQLSDQQKLNSAILEKSAKTVELSADRLVQEKGVTSELEKQRKSFEAQFTDRQKELGLISSDDYNQVLLGRESERLADPKLGLSPEQQSRGLDQYRQTIDPTLTEDLSQNTRSLKEELEELVNPINQITGAANAIGGAFSQSFTDAISGSKSAKEALADFFKSVGSYFLDMAMQIIAKMVTIAILNAVTGLLPGGGSSPGIQRALAVTPQTGAAATSTLNNFLSPRANGGPVSANTPYIVGERGPELMVPSTSGMVLSNSETRQQLTQQDSAMRSTEATRQQLTQQDSAMRSTEATRQQLNTQRNTMITNSTRETERMTEMMLSNPDPIDVRYESTVINNVEYVTAEQHRQGMAQAAERGRSLTLSALQGSVKTRKKVGLS